MISFSSLRRTVCAIGLAFAFGCSGSSETTSPRSTQPEAAFALAYEAEEDSDIARAQDGARATPGAAGAYVRLAEAFLVRRRETGDAALVGYAQDALRAARARAPRDPEVMRTEVMFLMEEHRFAEARDEARAVISADSDDTAAQLLLSDALLELGAYDEAVEALQAAMDSAPDLRAYSRAGYLRWLHGDVEGALEAMDAALQFAGAQAEPAAWCYVDLGWMLWHAGRLEAAAATATRARALVPDYLPALALEARVLAARGQAAAAIALLEGAASRQPTAADLVYLSELLADAGRAEEAAARLAGAEALATHDPLPVALYHARHDTDRARALALAEAAVTERDTVFTRGAHALALLRHGRTGEAAAAIERALRLGTPDPRLVLTRGLVELAAGDAGAARASLERAQNMNPHADPVLLDELRQGLSKVQK